MSRVCQRVNCVRRAAGDVCLWRVPMQHLPMACAYAAFAYAASAYAASAYGVCVWYLNGQEGCHVAECVIGVFIS